MLNQLKPNEWDKKEYKESKYKKITLNEMFARSFFKENVMVKKYNPNYINFTAPVFENWDIELSTPEGRKYFEIKVRNKTYNEMILEADKYNNLITNNKLSYYVNITTDTNKLIIWDLNNIDLNKTKIEKLKCPRTTYSDKNDYVMKNCYLLPIHKGYEIKYNYSIEEAIEKYKEELNN